MSKFVCGEKERDQNRLFTLSHPHYPGKHIFGLMFFFMFFDLNATVCFELSANRLENL